MDSSTLAFAGVAALLVVTPGIDFATVLRSALTGCRSGMSTAAGVLCGFVLHSCLAVVGVSVLVTSSDRLLAVLQVAGGCYLTVLGLRTLSDLTGRWPAGGRRRQETAEETQAAPGGLDPAAAFRSGFLGNALNPKAPVIWLSLLPQFIPPDAPAVPRVLLLSAILVLLGAVWYPLVVVLVTRFTGLLGRRRVRRRMQAVTGLCLVGLGIRVLAGR